MLRHLKKIGGADPGFDSGLAPLDIDDIEDNEYEEDYKEDKDDEDDDENKD